MLLRGLHECPRVDRQRIAALAVAVGQENRVRFNDLVPEPLRLVERVFSPFQVGKTVDERARQAQERVRPFGPQLGRLAESRQGFGVFVLRRRELLTFLVRIAINPMQVTLDVPQGRADLRIVRGRLRGQG